MLSSVLLRLSAGLGDIMLHNDVVCKHNDACDILFERVSDADYKGVYVCTLKRSHKNSKNF